MNVIIIQCIKLFRITFYADISDQYVVEIYTKTFISSKNIDSF